MVEWGASSKGWEFSVKTNRAPAGGTKDVSTIRHQDKTRLAGCTDGGRSMWRDMLILVITL